MRNSIRNISFALLCLSVWVLSGCHHERVTGVVCNVQGEALPGVAVMVEGTAFQDTTDALGQYAVPYEPGLVVLAFNKSGYTPGRLELEAQVGGALQASPVRLWRLPTQHGVYLYEDHRYLPTKPTQRERFDLAEGGVVYGSTAYDPEHPGALVTQDVQPRILCYSMPERGVQLHRLELKEISVGNDGDTVQVKAFVPEYAVPVSQILVDEPEGVLRQVKLVSPLTPGTYAVHWGALDASPTDPRLFFFTIAEPDAAVEDEVGEAAEAANAADSASPTPEE